MQVEFRHILSGGLIDSIEFLEVGRNGVEGHPRIVIVAVHLAIYSGEEHIEFRIESEVGLIVAEHIIVATAGCECLISLFLTLGEESIFRNRDSTLHTLGIDGSSLIDYALILRVVDNQGIHVGAHHHSVLEFADELLLLAGIEGFAIEQRCVAILLTVEIGGEVEDIVGRVLIHRSVGT